MKQKLNEPLIVIGENGSPVLRITAVDKTAWTLWIRGRHPIVELKDDRNFVRQLTDELWQKTENKNSQKP